MVNLSGHVWLLCCMPRGAGLGGPRRPPWPHGTPCMSPWEGARGAKGAFRAHRTPGPGTGPPPWSPEAPESPGPSRVPGGAPWGPASRPTWPHGGVQWGQEGTRVPGASADPRRGPVGRRPGPARPTWNHGGGPVGPRGLQGPPGPLPRASGDTGGPPRAPAPALGSSRYGNL